MKIEMKKNYLRLLSIYLLIIAVALISPQKMMAGTSYDEPTLGADGYYMIKTASNLAWLRDYINASALNDSAKARLENDIDLSDLGTSVNWTPIGNDKTFMFQGIFDGNNHAINNLYIHSTDESGRPALISYLGGTVKNLTINGNIYSANYASLFVNYSSSTATIIGCRSTGAVEGYSQVGGIVSLSEGKIVNCVNEATITNDGGDWTGGIVADNTGSVMMCMNTGNVKCSGSQKYYFGTGGIVGIQQVNPTSLLRDCANYGEIDGLYRVGGVIGHHYSGAVYNCYNMGNISAFSYKNAVYAGAIEGVLGDGSNTAVVNCYYLSTGTMKHDGIASSLIGSSTTSSNQNTYSNDSVTFASGKIARLLNGGNGSYELASGQSAYNTSDSCAWGQTIGTNIYPVFLKSDNSNAVYLATIYNGSLTDISSSYCNRNGNGLSLVNNQMAVLDDSVNCNYLGKNMISSNYKANNIVLTDKKDFAIPSDITTQSATYTRNAYRDGNYETFCIPFEPTTIPSDYIYYGYTYKNTDWAFFDDVTTLTAGNAYLMKYSGTASSDQSEVTFSATGGNITVKSVPVSSTFSGSYVTVSAPSESYYVLGVYDGVNQFRTPASLSLMPFRAYLDISSSSAKKLGIMIDGETTGISTVESSKSLENTPYYNVQGMEVQNPVNGELYIHNGQKTIYSNN